MKNTLVKLFATAFYLGYSPIISGTVGSLFGVIIFFGLIQLGVSRSVYPFILGGLFFAGVAVSTAAEKIFARKDARPIVIDEVVGCLVFLYLIPLKLWCIILGFIIYRLLDIIKPPPAGAAQRLPGGWGIMLDDLIAGVYTGIIIRVAIWLKDYF